MANNKPRKVKNSKQVVKSKPKKKKNDKKGGKNFTPFFGMLRNF